jgi:hypothetical protein
MIQFEELKGMFERAQVNLQEDGDVPDMDHITEKMREYFENNKSATLQEAQECQRQISEMMSAMEAQRVRLEDEMQKITDQYQKHMQYAKSMDLMQDKE